MATADLYGTMDPFQRTVVSPKRRGPSYDFNNDDPNYTDYPVIIVLFYLFLFRISFKILCDNQEIFLSSHSH